jgi:hypothetical protein
MLLRHVPQETKFLTTPIKKKRRPLGSQDERLDSISSQVHLLQRQVHWLICLIERDKI